MMIIRPGAPPGPLTMGYVPATLRNRRRVRKRKEPQTMPRLARTAAVITVLLGALGGAAQAAHADTWTGPGRAAAVTWTTPHAQPGAVSWG